MGGGLKNGDMGALVFCKDAQTINRLTLGHKLGDSLQVHDGDDGEERHEDQEVDLGR